MLRRCLTLDDRKTRVATSVHKEWQRIIGKVQKVVKEDADLKEKARRGFMLKERRLPPEVLGRLYADYCSLINRLYDAYSNSFQLQRAEYILPMVTLCVKRMYELRNELVNFIVNDYIYIDTALFQQKLIPQDIEIAIPYHFPMGARPDSVEKLLQNMWEDSIKRAKPKRYKPRPKKEVNIYLDEEEDFGMVKPIETVEEEELEEEEIYYK